MSWLKLGESDLVSRNGMEHARLEYAGMEHARMEHAGLEHATELENAVDFMFRI